MKTKLFIFFVIFFSVNTATFAQAKSGGGSAASGGTPANASLGPEHAGDLGKFSNWDELSKQGKAGDYLLGKVAIPGGNLPWDSVPVTVTCDGKTKYTANTDAKGQFVIAPVNSTSVTPGTLDAKPKLAAAFMGCNVQAALPGFDSSSVVIANRNLLDNPDIGTITLTREENSAGSAVSASTASAPKDASKAFEKARAEWLDKKPDRAQHDLEKAVQVYPQFAEAWYQLGKIQEAANSPDAVDSYSRASAVDPKFILPYERLASLEAKAGKWQAVSDATAHALELNPRGTPELWYFNALANYKLNKKDLAESSALKALAMDPLHTEPNTEQLVAVILADKHDFAGALEHLRNSLTYLPNGPNTELIKQQVAQLEKMVPAK
jgi:tetratricopeptide (TPR) repeat protein